MHPQLSDKRIICREFIQALEACHASTWLRLTGGCNGQKHALNKCLHKETLKRSAKNREEAKEKRSRIEQGWKELHKE